MSDTTYNPHPRSPQTPQQRPPQKKSSSGSSSASQSVSFLVLGICLIISACIIKSAVKDLTEAVTAQTFSSTLNSPSVITVKNTAEKNYFTEDEAAEYLNLSKDDIVSAITKGEIDEYIKTSSGYSISKDELDTYFKNKAYQTLVNNNSETE